MRPPLRLAALSVLLLNACYPPGDGKAPPLDEIYFPTGVALDGSWQFDGDAAPKYLYVANSDFDLQYRSSSLISYDLEKLSKLVPRSCNTDDDCQDLGMICDAWANPSLPQAAPGESRANSYFCVSNSSPVEPCGAFGELDAAYQVLTPGRCNSIDPLHPQDGSQSLKVDSVGIGAFATDVLWRPNCENKADDVDCVRDPDAPSRLFIPVRGDSTLHWIDVLKSDDPVREGHFDCGANNGDEDGCDGLHRAGDSGDDNLYDLTQPPEPFGLDATDDAEFVAVTNQTTGTVSLYHNSAGDGPELVSIASGLPLAPIGVATIPRPKFNDDADRARYAPSFLVSYRNAAEIDLLRVREDAPYLSSDTSREPYTRYVLRRVGSVPVNANSLNFDQRGIAIDDSQRQAEYAVCQESKEACTGASNDCVAAYVQCLKTVHQPSVYAASRAPASMLLGALTTDLNFVSGTSELPSFTDSLPLSFGPSRVVVGKVRVPGTKFLDGHGGSFDLASRVFIVCFDSRRIFVYDPERRAIEAIVNTGRGPHALAVDEMRGLAYVGHFTDSYLGVISLDLRFPKSYAAIVASVGTPKAPRSSK